MIIFLSILIGIITILLLITVHEFAHFVVAKISGAYVYEFSVGMGPKIFQWGKKETRYTIRLLPLGGYVSIASELADPPKNRETEVVPTEKMMENINRGKKAGFIISGALMNLIIAFILLMISYGIVPLRQDLNNPPTFANQGQLYQAVKKNPQIKKNMPITEIDVDKKDSSKVNPWKGNSFNDLKSWIINDAKVKIGDKVTFIFNNDVNKEVVITLDKDNFLGVTASNTILSQGEIIKYGFTDTFVNSFAVLKALGKLITFNWSDLSGPVGIVKEAHVFLDPNNSGSENTAIYFKWASLLSANFFLLNLIPFPPLDGYKFVENAVEATLRKKINTRAKIIITIVGAILFLGLFIAITIKDIFL